MPAARAAAVHDASSSASASAGALDGGPSTAAPQGAQVGGR
jgi:hypothetical protein